jgi:hypothetical protein
VTQHCIAFLDKPSSGTLQEKNIGMANNFKSLGAIKPKDLKKKITIIC